MSYTEDTLVQRTTADYLENPLGWRSVYAYNNEDFGPDSLLGRGSDREVVLERTLREKLAALNPGLPAAACDEAVRQVTATVASQTLVATNREKYALMRDGVQVTFRNEKGERDRHRLRLFDFIDPDNNDFLCVRELWVRGDLYRRRADITGFDVPTLSTLYLDKPLKAHTLMQAIARANRVAEGKNNGLIVDYCGILKHLRKALATFAGTKPEGEGDETDPARPEEELLADLAEAIVLVRAFLDDREASLDAVIRQAGFERNGAIIACKEAANQNDESRKRFEVMSREVFKKFKACINVPGVNAHRADRDAIDIVYKSLQQDREQADITHIIWQLHEVVDEAIEVRREWMVDDDGRYDISRIDFDRLRREFESSPKRNTTVQNLRQVVEERLQRLLQQNPLRTDFQQHYEQIVAEYNREKDRATIEKTFEELFNLVRDLGEEEHRAVREGLDEETLAIFDLLRKPDLTAAETRRIKKVSVELLARLKAEKLRVDHWRDKEATRDAVRLTIRDYLWDESTGLPVGAFDEEEVGARADDIFRHVYRAYPRLPSPLYPSVSP